MSLVLVGALSGCAEEPRRGAADRGPLDRGAGDRGPADGGGPDQGLADRGPDQDPADATVDRGPLPRPRPIVARRQLSWVCDGRFGAEGGFEALAPVEDGSGQIGITPTAEPCQFHLVHEDGGAPRPLSATPGGYLLAAAVTVGAQTVACASRIDHVAGGGPAVGARVLRETTGVAVECAQAQAGRWQPLQTLLPAPDGWAPWITGLAPVPGSQGHYRLDYDRDFSFQFLNLTQLGRPATDGAYAVEFAFDAAGNLVASPPERAAEGMAGPPDPPPDPCPPGEIQPGDPRCAPRCGDGSCDPQESCADCAEDCGLCGMLVDDAHDPGYLEPAGQWQTAAGHAEFSRFSDSADARARFDFPGLRPGPKEIWVSHPVDPAATPRAVHRILSPEGARLAELISDQRAGDAGFRLLGTVDTDGDFLVEVSAGAPGRLYADAVRVEAVIEQDPVIDDKDGRYREEGTWQTALGGEGGQHRQGVGAAHYSARITPGEHTLWLHYPASAEAALVELIVRVDDRFVTAITLDQRRGGGAWWSLGRLRLAGQRVGLELRSLEGGLVRADAFRLEAVSGPPAGEIQRVDTQDPRYLETGLWADSVLPGEGPQLRWSPDGEGSARWQFTGLAPDFYQVEVSFPASARNTPAARYTLRSAGSALGVFTVDQTRGGGRQVLGRLWLPGPTASLELTAAAAGALRADVVRLIPAH